ncbi:ATP-binding protein [Bacillus sp. SCS-153A]|uniref:ATP-binding protein n=1 Tax=Rossellomorea sedimentorum TaxID=3115294 RepID=UPI003906CC0C
MVYSQLLNGLLINLLVILVVILMVNFYHLSKHKSYDIQGKRLPIFILCTILIILSISLSVELESGFIYDLRFIPFLLGGIYGGKRVLFALAAVMILIRIPLSGTGLMLTVVITILTCLAVLYLSPKLLEKTWTSRVYLFTSLSLGYSILGFFIPSLIFGFHNFISFIIYTAMLAGSTFLVFYLCEIIRTTYSLQLESIKYEKMQVVSHLAASISHEVRNPLTTVRGFLQLIHEDSSNIKANKELSQIAVEEIDRATEVINQYLSFAKPHPETQVKLDVTNEIHKLKEIISPLAMKYNVVIKMDVSTRHAINGEPNKFQQIMINILKNGIEAMENGGILSIECFEKGEQVFILIKDTGMGMTDEQITRLGEPYFSLKGKKGTGLGMMTVFQLVQVMNGKIKVTSKLNEGTTVTLSFPIVMEQE